MRGHRSSDTRRGVRGIARIGVAVLALTGAALVAAPGAGAAAADPAAPVRNDGRPIAVANAAASSKFSPSFAGTGVSSAPESSSVEPSLPYGAVAPEYIIGADNRVQVNPTTTYPARATVFIYWTTPGSWHSCTGFLINANTVATAGHCVSPGNGTWYPQQNYTVYAGKNGNTNPYGSCTVKWMGTTVGWKNSGDWNYDYAALKLNCTVGNTVGWYGYFWQSASLTGSAAYTRGYPGDKTFGTQWYTSDSITSSNSYVLKTNLDIYPGQSGSAVYRTTGYNGAACNPCAMGVVSSQWVSGSTKWNQAARINEQAYNNYASWKASS